MLDFIINHQRFKKQFYQNELIKYLPDENRIIEFPQYSKNYYKTVKYDLNCAEKSRKFKIIKNCIKILIPFFILKLIRKIRNKKIKF